MSQGSDTGIGVFVGKTVALAAAWLASWTLGEVQQLVGIVSALIIIGYTLAQWAALRRREREAKRQKEQRA